MRYVIGNYEFPTKKEAEAQVRRVLHESALDTPLAGDDLDLIRGLIGCHPEAEEKIGPGIAGIEVRRIEYGARGFWITRTDGTADDISYKKALSGAPTHQAAVKAAMRSAVRDQIDDFRRQWFDEHGDIDGLITCQLTGQKVALGQAAHVDHVKPFGLLADEFASRCGGYDAIVIGSSTEHVGSALADPVQLAEWRRFHAQQAQLRVIHGSANLARYARRNVA